MRRSLFKVETSRDSVMATNNVPSYPSEDAVESAVNTVLLTLLFPTAVDEITAKAAEQQQAALLSGRAAPSDIAAGVALGQDVPAVFSTRAANDGRKAPGRTAAIWPSLAEGATARGEFP